MARPRPEKKGTPAKPSITRIPPCDSSPATASLPSPESEKWSAVPTSAGGKRVHARVQYVGQPATAVVWVWGAHERIGIKVDQADKSGPSSAARTAQRRRSD